MEDSIVLLRRIRDDQLAAYAACTTVRDELIVQMDATIERVDRHKRVQPQMSTDDATARGTEMQRQVTAERTAQRERATEVALELDLSRMNAVGGGAAKKWKWGWEAIRIYDPRFIDDNLLLFRQVKKEVQSTIAECNMAGGVSPEVYGALFDPALFVSCNFVQSVDGYQEVFPSQQDKLPLQLLVVKQPGRDARFILLDLYDAECYAKRVRNETPVSDQWSALVSVISGKAVRVSKNASAIDVQQMEQSPEVQRCLLQIWVLSGDVVRLDRKQLQPAIAQWLNTPERARAAEALLLAKAERALYTDSVRLRTTIERLKVIDI